ncbi:ABC transporter, permease protein [hydrothermal vent metagenome]|uniref:ABC transporter, permease protein n=1 Tax=hydrothermal vent metagenome TaxID=652676 RepID=A0A3B0VP39_9ZZZZ
MKTFKALLEREYWEHRGAFLKTPIVIGIVMAATLLLIYFFADRVDLKMNSGQLTEFGSKSIGLLDPADIRMGIDAFMLSTAYLYHFILFIIVFFFLLGSLYDDRKDGSILFWKSLPVSDTQTVLSKLATATIIAPLIFTLGLILSHLLFFIILSLILLLNGVNPFTFLWVNISFINNWGAFLVGCLIQALWALPIYGWLLFASSYSKRRPFLIAIFVPLGVAFTWYWYVAFTNFDVIQAGLFKTILFIFAKAASPFTSGISLSADQIDFDPTDQSSVDVIYSMMNGLSTPGLYYGLIFAVIVIALAIFVRRFRNTT